MRHSGIWRAAGIVLAGVLALSNTGCVEWLMTSHAAFFGAGWLMRDATIGTTTERTCFENGVLVDCATLPEDVQP